MTYFNNAVNIKTLLTFFFLLFILPFSFAQVPKKAEKAYNKGLVYLKQNDFHKAIVYFEKALSISPNYQDALMSSADVNFALKRWDNAEAQYEEIKKINLKGYYKSYFNIGKINLEKGNYGKALENFKEVKKYNNAFSSYKTHIDLELFIANCEFGIEAKKNPVAFEPHNLGDSVNSVFEDVLPALTADGDILIFTRRVDNRNEDFYFSLFENGKWSIAKPLEGEINSDDNEGAHTISADGRFIFFTLCNRSDGRGRCDIYVSEKKMGKFTSPVNVGKNVNTEYWDAQPSISADNKTLFFISSRLGGFGGTDIYMCQKLSDGTWDKAINLGASINTPYDEKSPYIHPDGKTLYFASEGHPGMGKMDLYLTRLVDGDWTKPVNLGFPLNDHSNQTCLYVNPEGNLGYFSSDRDGGKGLNDIYSFELHKKARPDRVIYLRGFVYNKITKQQLTAFVEIKDLETGKTILSGAYDTKFDPFLSCLPGNKQYSLFVSSVGYLPYSEMFTLIDSGLQNQRYNVPMTPIAVNEEFVLKNIFFDTDSFALNPMSLYELDNLANYLKQNKSLSLEIQGHTDNTGNTAFNLELSKKRAQSVYSYLRTKEIAFDRLDFVGYGDKAPIASNETAYGKAQNRRTQFKVTNK